MSGNVSFPVAAYGAGSFLCARAFIAVSESLAVLCTAHGTGCGSGTGSRAEGMILCFLKNCLTLVALLNAGTCSFALALTLLVIDVVLGVEGADAVVSSVAVRGPYVLASSELTVRLCLITYSAGCERYTGCISVIVRSLVVVLAVAVLVVGVVAVVAIVTVVDEVTVLGTGRSDKYLCVVGVVFVSASYGVCASAFVMAVGANVENITVLGTGSGIYHIISVLESRLNYCITNSAENSLGAGRYFSGLGGVTESVKIGGCTTELYVTNGTVNYCIIRAAVCTIGGDAVFGNRLAFGVSESCNNLLRNENLVTYGAVLAFGKTGFCTSSINSLIGNLGVSKGCNEFCVTYGTDLCCCTSSCIAFGMTESCNNLLRYEYLVAS